MALTKKQRQILDAIVFLVRQGELPTVREVGALVGLRSPATVLKHLRALEAERVITMSGKSRGIRIADPKLLAELLGDEKTVEQQTVRRETVGQETVRRETVGQETVRRETGEAADSTAGDSSQGAADTKDGAPLESVPGLFALNPSKLRQEETRQAIESLTAKGNVLQAQFARLAAGVPVCGSIAAGQPIETKAEAYSDGGSQSTLAIDPRMFGTSGEIFALRIEGDSMINIGILDGDFAVIRRQSQVEEGEVAAVLIDGEATLKRWSVSTSASTPNRAGLGLPGSGMPPFGGASLDGDDNDPAADLDETQALQQEFSGGELDESTAFSEQAEQKAVRLVAENERYDPLEISEKDRKEVFVVGKYVGLVRGVQGF